MSVLDFFIAGLVVDISFIVVTAYFFWKNRKMSNKISYLEEKLILTTLNPQKARRTLKNNNNKL
tara:strand:- start:1410 stop:1601 length:192 start_codon:yes stop_codon:yes gene_type:complete